MKRSCTLFAAAISLAAAELPPVSPLGDLSYSRRIWQSADGLPEDFAQALAQTPDGYLWIGASGGLVRFDGVRFTVFGPRNEPAFHDDSVFSLRTSRDGTLWIGTEGGGLIRYSHGHFRAYGVADGLTNGFVRTIYEDREGKIWIGTDKGLFRKDGEQLVRIDGENGIPRLNVNSVCEDREGRLLAGGTGLLVLSHGAPAYYRDHNTQASDNVRVLYKDREGAIWIGTVAGLRRIEGGLHGNPFLTPPFLDGVQVSAIHEAPDAIWIGTYGRGLLRWKDGAIVRIAAPYGLPHDNVLSVTDDREGNLWVGTQGGLQRISPSVVRTLPVPGDAAQSVNTVYRDPVGAVLVVSLSGHLFQAEGSALVPFKLPPSLTNIPMRNAFRARDGALWLGSAGYGVIRLSLTGEIKRMAVTDGLVNDFARAFLETRDGTMWIGTNGGVSRWRDGSFHNFNVENGLIYNSIRALVEDHSGVVWIATDGGITRIANGSFLPGGALDALNGQKVWALFEDADGAMWLGTHGAGLHRFFDGRITRFNSVEGIPAKIHMIAQDAHGNLWLSSPSGVVSVPRHDLDAIASGGKVVVTPRLYNTSDGLLTNQMNGGVQSAGIVSQNGETWIPSTAGVVVLTPDTARSAALPPVLLEQAIAGDRPVPVTAGSPVRVEPGTGKLELHYTAIRLRSPERLRFRYWMEGAEREWNEVGDRRIAYFTNLSPGKYTFHVAAWDVDDPAHKAEQIFPVVLLPAFYQTWWFMLLAGVLAISLVWAIYLLHLRNVRRRFEAVLEERNRMAREMHDTVIQGAVGVSTLLEAASSTGDSAPDVSRMLIERARREIRGTVEDARAAVWNMRHSEEGGDIAGAISRLVQRVSGESGIPVELTTLGSPIALAAEAERGVTLSVREALSNAVRHAAASRIQVTLRFAAGTVEVEVRDNGRGFEWTGTAPGESLHYGLIGMKERMEKLGGGFDLSSGPGAGTQVRFRLPIAQSV